MAKQARPEFNTYRRNQIFNDLGVFGWNDVSLYVMTCFLSGTTPCIIGAAGAGKTMAFNRLARSLGMKSQLWDTSKVTEEILSGMPDIEALKQGKVKFIQDETTNAVWDKHIGLFDEATRCNPQIQNTLLELLRNKTFNGQQTQMLLSIMTANDLSYSGTEPLDAAFAARIGLVFDVPEMHDMPAELRLKIIKNMERSDALMLGHWDPSRKAASDYDDFSEHTDAVQKYFKDAATMYGSIEATYGEMLAEYVDKVIQTLHIKAGRGASGGKGLPGATLDGRRAGMIYRNLIAGIAIESMEYKLSTKDIQRVVEDIWLHSLPYKLTGEKIEVAALKEAHSMAVDILEERALIQYFIMTEKNPIKQTMLAIRLRDQDPMALFDQIDKMYVDAYEEDKNDSEEVKKRKEKLRISAALISLCNVDFRDKMFGPLMDKEEYSEFTKKVEERHALIFQRAFSSIDPHLKRVRAATAPRENQTQEDFDNEKQIQQHIDMRFREVIIKKLGITEQEVIDLVEKLNSGTKKEKDEAGKKLRENSVIWFHACLLFSVVTSGQLLKGHFNRMASLFDECLQQVHDAHEIIHADYDELRRQYGLLD